jgi:hypothetical protein
LCWGTDCVGTSAHLNRPCPLSHLRRRIAAGGGCQYENEDGLMYAYLSDSAIHVLQHHTVAAQLTALAGAGACSALVRAALLSTLCSQHLQKKWVCSSCACFRVCSALCAGGYMHLHAVRPDVGITWFESTLVLRRFQSRLLLRRTSKIRNTLYPRVCRCAWLHRKAQCQSAHIWGAVAFSTVVTVNVVPKSVYPEVRVGSSTGCGFVGH